MKWRKESELALKALSEGLLTLQNSGSSPQIVSRGASCRDISTNVDLSIENRIRSVLADSPHAIVGEESFSATEGLPARKTTWIIDPLDGTVNFASSVPFFAISIGLVSGGRFTVGCVAIPPSKEIYYTFGDQGSFINKNRLRARDVPLEDSLIAASFSSRRQNPASRRKEFDVFREANDTTRGCLRTGSAAVNVCYAAAGRFQGAFGVGSPVWDVAGALAIAVQAGCRVLIDWPKGSHVLSYAVGTPVAASYLAELLRSSGTTDLKPLS